MKNNFKLLISLLFTFIIFAANAATFTIINNSTCSEKTIYQAFSSKNPISISPTYTYSENGLYIENGNLYKDSHKNINLNNSHGTVQIIKTTTISKEKNTPPAITEYFLAQNKFCTILENKKTCYEASSQISSSIQQLCSTQSIHLGNTAAAVTSGISNVSPQDISSNKTSGNSPTAAQVTNSPTEISQEELNKGLANGTITVGGSLMKPIYQSK